MVQGIRSGRGCVQDCSAWGGGGTCITSSSPHTCLCDEGFASKDAMGYASCVPRKWLISGYVVVAAVSSISAAIILWHICRYRHLPEWSKNSRRTGIRLRMLLSSRWVVWESSLEAPPQEIVRPLDDADEYTNSCPPLRLALLPQARWSQKGNSKANSSDDACLQVCIHIACGCQRVSTGRISTATLTERRSGASFGLLFRYLLKRNFPRVVTPVD